jgi:hypothetical protein
MSYMDDGEEVKVSVDDPNVKPKTATPADE